MGVCAQQHRVITGMYNSILLKACTNNLVDEISATDALILTLSVVGLILYLYILCLLMAVCVEIPHCSVQHSHHLAISQTLSNPYFCNKYRELLNTCFLALSTYIFKNISQTNLIQNINLNIYSVSSVAVDIYLFAQKWLPNIHIGLP